MGDWLKQNGEAIYGTKPWHRYGEGPTHDGDGGRHDLGRILTADDVRFTRSDSALYATVCGWRTEPIQLRSLGKADLKDLSISDITLLGSTEKITWTQSEDHLSIQFPHTKTSEFAYVFKIEGMGHIS